MQLHLFFFLCVAFLQVFRDRKLRTIICGTLKNLIRTKTTSKQITPQNTFTAGVVFNNRNKKWKHLDGPIYEFPSRFFIRVIQFRSCANAYSHTRTTTGKYRHFLIFFRKHANLDNDEWSPRTISNTREHYC